MHLIPTMNNARDTPLTTRARSDAAPLRAKLGALARTGPAPAGRATRAGPDHTVPARQSVAQRHVPYWFVYSEVLTDHSEEPRTPLKFFHLIK